MIDYLSQSENELTLFITRHKKVTMSLIDNEMIEIQKMNFEKTKTFLTKSLTRKELLHDRIVIIELLHELINLSLTIAQATTYLNARQIFIRDYLFLLRKIEQNIINLLSREFRDETQYKNSKNSIVTT